ncbi:hypothetical protein D3C78_1575080 [compost metagenome]
MLEQVGDGLASCLPGLLCFRCRLLGGETCQLCISSGNTSCLFGLQVLADVPDACFVQTCEFLGSLSSFRESHGAFVTITAVRAYGVRDPLTFAVCVSKVEQALAAGGNTCD